MTLRIGFDPTLPAHTTCWFGLLSTHSMFLWPWDNPAWARLGWECSWV